MAETDDETKWSRAAAKEAGAFKFIGKHRRAVEHRRFVLGKGRFGADIVPNGLLHVADRSKPPCQRKNHLDRHQPGTGS